MQKLRHWDIKDDAPDSTSVHFLVKGSEGSGEYNIQGKCEQDDSGKRKSCYIDECLLKVWKTKKLKEEQYKNKHMTIYKRSHDGPLKYESEA